MMICPYGIALKCRLAYRSFLSSAIAQEFGIFPVSARTFPKGQ